MRIIGGEFSGLRFRLPVGLLKHTRPTTQRTREALFNVLAHRRIFDDTVCLEVFAGTAMFSWEALSRGARQVYIVEKSARLCAYLREQSARFTAPHSSKVICTDALNFLRRTPQTYHFIFADPPYHYLPKTDIHACVFNRGLLKPNGMLVIEHPNEQIFSTLPHHLLTKYYAHTSLSFFCFT